MLTDLTYKEAHAITYTSCVKETQLCHNNSRASEHNKVV